MLSFSKISLKQILFSPISLTLLVCWIYWSYLVLTTHMIIVHDAITYEELGRIINEEGINGFFKYKSGREPIYPFLGSASFYLSERLGIFYQDIQKFIQFLILFVTQLLTLTILRQLKIKRWIQILVIFYIGFSPVLVNSSLWLFSEIASYPFLLMIIIFSYRCWEDLFTQNNSRVVLNSICLSLSLLGATFVKAVFEIITPCYLFLFAIFTIKALMEKNKNIFKNTVILLTVVSIVYLIPVNLFKYANKKSGANFAIADRGSWALYGNTVRRMEPLNLRRFLTAVTYIPDSTICNQIFGEQTCLAWSYVPSDNYGAKKRQELESRMSPESVNRELIRLSSKEVIKNPFQYSLFCILESLKFFFWERTQSGLVVYPLWIENILANSYFGIALLISMSILSLTGFVSSGRWVLRKTAIIFNIPSQASGEEMMILFIVWLIFLFLFFHSFFFVLARYSLPIACLFLILIARWIDKKI